MLAEIFQNSNNILKFVKTTDFHIRCKYGWFRFCVVCISEIAPFRFNLLLKSLFHRPCKWQKGEIILVYYLLQMIKNCFTRSCVKLRTLLMPSLN